MLKITGGNWNNRKLAVPKGLTVRPTTGRVRQSVLEKLRHRLPGACWLDGFAGSGIMGFEALSRGAKQVIAVEKNRAHAQAIRHNRETLGLDNNTYKLFTADMTAWVKRSKPDVPFDLIYLDPPYDLRKGLQPLIEHLLSDHWLTAEGLLLLEQAPDSPLLNLPYFTEHWRYGDTVVCVGSALSNAG